MVVVEREGVGEGGVVRDAASRVVDEDVLAPVLGDEPKALRIIEPLDGTECHVCNFHTKNKKIDGFPRVPV